LDDPARSTRCAKCFDANGPRGDINPLARFEEDAVTGVLNIAEDLESHRTYLLRLARLQLRDDDLAQDVVQETMVAALSAPSFSGASSLRTWLTGILKHKIVDAIRKRQRRPEILASQIEAGEDAGPEEFDSPFDENGSWVAKPASWGDPEYALQQRQFFDVMALCMEHLPANTARVFMMREYMDLEVAEISHELSITAGNIHVILFRARAALRQCLEKNWFAGGPLPA
jgi:RNA polymerase sigma-70 factor (ECF subfamily)